jgi:beta-lactamase regulating signal transducer with metallopeptidase domain
MTGPELQVIANILAGRLLNSAAEGMLLAGLIWGLLRLVGRQGAKTRFAICFAALLAIVALPFADGSGLLSSPSRASTHPGITLSSSWALYLFAAWAMVVGLMLLRLAVGLWRVHRLRDRCTDVNLVSLDPAIAGMLREFAAGHRVKLCVSREVAAPAAIGFLRPAIVFPAWLLPQLSAGEIKVILPHELAHLRRWDPWTNLAQKIATALFFFHPGVWWIDSRLTLEREMACDDVVLAESASPKAYASFLISFAEKLQNVQNLELAQSLVTRMHQMSLRVAQILGTGRSSRTGYGKSVLAASAALFGLVLGTAPYAPQLVGFGNQPARSQAPPAQASMAKQAAQPISAATAASPRRAVAEAGVQPLASAQKVRAIPAAFHPSAAVLPLSVKAGLPGKPLLRRAKAARQPSPGQVTLVILRSSQDGPNGFGVWALCIWRVEGGSRAERRLETAIVASSI